ncbi:MAG TPA: sulfite exporter TauE/SafE family protein [Bdellovibrionota bacterium]|jgi:uncharacterized membrane protein YfcA|nr:sulfite exporter TauE/SafE family protein [Bdellovibrionota bacterium]
MIEMFAMSWVPLVLISAGAGFIGALLGLGGGFIIVPVLTLLYGFDMRSAVGAALVAVIATSSGSSVTYLKRAYSNLELAAFLEISTVIGAVIAVLVAGQIPPKVLYICFALLMLVSATMMAKNNFNHHKDAALLPDPEAPKGFSIEGSFHEPSGAVVKYHTRHTWIGFGLSGFAGLMSGLLGVGGGIVKVPTMNLIMGVPLKAASATSNLMVGMTAASTAILMFSRGEIPIETAAYIAVGVYFGARAGSRKLHGTSNRNISLIFAIVAAILAYQMFMKGLRL